MSAAWTGKSRFRFDTTKFGLAKGRYKYRTGSSRPRVSNPSPVGPAHEDTKEDCHCPDLLAWGFVSHSIVMREDRRLTRPQLLCHSYCSTGPFGCDSGESGNF